MNKLYQITVALLFLLIGMQTPIQAQVEINTQTFTTDTENEIVVVFTVKNFESISSMQFTLNWNPTILEFKSIGEYNLEGFTNANVNQNIAETGELPVAWVDPQAVGITVDDGTSLFSITFNKLSEVPTEIFFDNTPTLIEFVKGSLEEVFLTSSSNAIVTTGRLLEGTVLFDTNENCTADNGEKGLKDWLIEVNGERNVFKITNQEGVFRAFLPFGDYNVKVIPPLNNYFSICEPEQAVSILEGATELVKIAFTGQAVIDCPSLSVEIATPFLRRCFENNYTVTYCNNGTISAEDAFVLVKLDPFLTFIDSSIPSSLVEQGVYRFDIGTVEFNECGTFEIKVKVDCEGTELGQTHCVTARIFPDIICEPPSDSWSKASLEVKGECVGDAVQFHIQNIGEGNMQQELQFVVIQDMILLRNEREHTFQLQSGQTKTVSFNADGSTYRLETQQVPFHPMEMLLASAIEGCGTNEIGTFSKGMINMFSAADESQFIDMDCQQNRGAFDPNDKNAFPSGYQSAHYIAPNTQIDYHIRFQNTGTDTAFNIVVLDTLSNLLDISTIVPLVSSHPYSFEIVDSNILKFSFNNIMLPDSNINEIASNGFFKFSIQQQVDVAIGSIIENSAAIYFDFNAPVITNTYSHTVGIDFIEARVITSTNDFSPISMKISPNPLTQTATIRIDNPNHSHGQFLLYDLQGRKVREYEFFGNEFQLQKGNLAEGMYLFEVHSDGQILGSGKLVVR